MIHIRKLFVLFMVLWGLLPGSGSAGVSVDATEAVGRVLVFGAPVIAFRADNAGLTPPQRAGVAARRIESLMQEGQPASKIAARGSGQSASVFWGKQVIAHATRADAQAQNTTPLALAESWAKQMRQQLSLPPVRIIEKSLTIPVNENRRASVRGTSKGPFTVTLTPSTLGEVRTEADGSVVILGKTAGSGTLSVVAPDGSDSIAVTVGKYAGRLSELTPVAQVTGSTVSDTVISEAVWRAARLGLQLEPGADPQITLGVKPKALQSWETSQLVPVTIRITGQGYLPAQIKANVAVQRINLGYQDPEVLFYSNHPEQVKTPQPLYAAALTPNQSSRLLYHHQNGTGNRLRVSIILVNTSDAPAPVHLIGGLAGPVQDTILVGYQAGARFLRDVTSNTGYVVNIPARTRIVLWTDVLGKMDTASGIVQMRQIGGENGVLVRVLSEPVSVYRSISDVNPAASSDYMSRFSNHQYPTPVRKLVEEYSAGGRWVFIRLGRHHLRDVDDQLNLYGNYGVTYDINLTLTNPTSDREEFQVVFNATAGISGIATLINGEFKGKSHVATHREEPLVKYVLNPGERRQVRLSTLPLAGSHYPATIIVRSRG